MISRHILVVDDEETTRSCMALVLENAGFKVTSAESGRAALEAVKRQKKGEPFDFLLFDICMPDTTGPELIEELERQDIHLPSLAVTGHADTDVALALQAKGCHVLEKPFHGVHLLERIFEIMGHPQTEGEGS